MSLSLAALGLMACSDDIGNGADVINPDSENQTYDGKWVSFNAAIALPFDSSRSATDDDDITDGDKTNSDADPDSEVGTDAENEVRSVLLVFATTNDEYLTHAVVKNVQAVGDDPSKPIYRVRGDIKYKVLEDAYANGGLLDQNKKVHIYAYCNYTGRMLDRFNYLEKHLENSETYPETDDIKGNWYDWEGQVDEDAAWVGDKLGITNSIWSDRSFFMCNARVREVSFPAKLEDWDQYCESTNAYDLTDASNSPIYVERAAARLDFKDGSDGGDQTYPIDTQVYNSETESTTLNYFSIKLTRMSLVNMSKKFHYIRRVSSDGMAKGASNDWTLAGQETSSTGKTPYVVDFDVEAKSSDAIHPENAAEYFNFPLYESKSEEVRGTEKIYYYQNKNWYVDNISDILSSDKTDRYNGKTDYHVWRYVTENTLPGISTQQTKQSIGIVFKGAIQAGDDLGEIENFSETDGATHKNYETYLADEGENNPLSEALWIALQNAKHNYDPAKGPGSDDDKYKYPNLYYFQNMLYAGIEELIYGAYEWGPQSPLGIAVNDILSNFKLKYNEEGKGVFEYDPTSAVDDELDGGASAAATENLEEGMVLDLETAWFIYQIVNRQITAGEKYEKYKGVTFGFTNDEINFRNHAAPAGITVYVAYDESTDNHKHVGGWGYYCYYFYWLRHNDNGLDSKMGPMEFASVRNNVYKLSVQSISQLGHPRLVENDPDPVQPDDPDEEPLAYLKIDVQVLPWVVRLNNIKF